MGNDDLIQVTDLDSFNTYKYLTNHVLNPNNLIIDWSQCDTTNSPSNVINWIKGGITMTFDSETGEETVKSHKRRVALDILKNGYTEDKAKEFDSI